MRRILIIIAAVICLCGCEKESHHWLYGFWYGEYDEYMISMEFSADGSECTVTTAFTNGNLGMNKVNYFVYVNEQNQSFFWPKRDGSRIELKKIKAYEYWE